MTLWPDPRYRELTSDLLAAISADDVGNAVAQHVQLRFVASRSDRDTVVSALPAGTRSVYATWLVDMDVNDGGFNLFFFKRSARLAGLALSGYELFGAEDYVSIMRAAIATHESERERVLPFYRSRSAETFNKSYDVSELGEVDQRYYALGDRIYNIWAGLARTRPELFAEG